MFAIRGIKCRANILIVLRTEKLITKLILTSFSNKSHIGSTEPGIKHEAQDRQRRDPRSLYGHVRYTKPLRDYGYHPADWIERISHARTRRAHSRPHWRATERASIYVWTYGILSDEIEMRISEKVFRHASSGTRSTRANSSPVASSSLIFAFLHFLSFRVFCDATIHWNSLLIETTLRTYVYK